MAASPGSVSKALTMRGAQVSWSILHGGKVVENRPWRIKPGWYGLHTGTGPIAEDTAKRIRTLVPHIPPESTLAHGVIVGAMRVSHNGREGAWCASSPWTTGPFCSVISETVALPNPVPHKGALGLWEIGVDVLGPLQAAKVLLEGANAGGEGVPAGAVGGGDAR